MGPSRERKEIRECTLLNQQKHLTETNGEPSFLYMRERLSLPIVGAWSTPLNLKIGNDAVLLLQRAPERYMPSDRQLARHALVVEAAPVASDNCAGCVRQARRIGVETVEST